MDNVDSAQAAQWIEVRKAGKLLFRLDPPRCLLEIVDRRKGQKVNLADYGLVFQKPSTVAQLPDLT